MTLPQMKACRYRDRRSAPGLRLVCTYHIVLASLSSDGEHCCAVFSRDSRSVSMFEGYRNCE